MKLPITQGYFGNLSDIKYNGRENSNALKILLDSACYELYKNIDKNGKTYPGLDKRFGLYIQDKASYEVSQEFVSVAWCNMYSEEIYMNFTELVGYANDTEVLGNFNKWMYENDESNFNEQAAVNGSQAAVNKSNLKFKILNNIYRRYPLNIRNSFVERGKVFSIPINVSCSISEFDKIKGVIVQSRSEGNNAEPEKNIESKDQAPVCIKQVAPVYPKELLAEGIVATVLIDFIVDINGDVRDASIIRSDRREFDSVALNAVNQWKFKPAKIKGRVSDVHLQVPISFAK